MLRRFHSILLMTVFLALVVKLATMIVWPADWSRTQQVVIYPVNGDGRLETEQYIQALSVEHFASIETFMSREAQAWQLPNTQPVSLTLAEMLPESPPTPPLEGNGAEYLNWSLRIRYWAWSCLPNDAPISGSLCVFSPRVMPIGWSTLLAWSRAESG